MSKFKSTIAKPPADIKLLIYLLLIMAGLWFFLEITFEMLEGDTETLDNRILLALRTSSDVSDPLGPLWFEEMMRDVTGIGGVGVLSFITIVCTVYLFLEHKPRIAILLLLAIVTGITTSFILKSGFDRPRPDLVPHGSHVYTSSFPSGHSMMSALVYITLASMIAQVHERRRIKIYLFSIAIFISLLVGFSRVYLGVHWPTDVIAGWLAGTSWALLFFIIGHYLQKRRIVEDAGVEPELFEECEDK